MGDSQERFATAVNCMDGRAIEATNAYLKNKYEIDYVDSPTEPGIDGFCKSCDESAWEGLRRKVVDISVGHHGSRIVAIVGHAECAGNDVTKEEHIACIKSGLVRVSEWDFKVDEPVVLVGLWVEKDNGVWTAEPVDEMVKDPQKRTEEAA